MKIINEDDNNDNDGSGSNNDNDAKDYGDNYDNSYSNHHEIYDEKGDNDDDNSDNKDQIMLKLLYIQVGKIFRFNHFATFFEIQSLNDSPWDLL